MYNVLVITDEYLDISGEQIMEPKLVGILIMYFRIKFLKNCFEKSSINNL